MRSKQVIFEGGASCWNRRIIPLGNRREAVPDDGAEGSEVWATSFPCYAAIEQRVVTVRWHRSYRYSFDIAL